MSKLIVAIFNNEHRALQVVSEIRRTHKPRTDFDNALVLTWNDSDLIVQPSVNLADPKTGAWARLWGAFLCATTMQNTCREIEESARNLQEAVFQWKKKSGKGRQITPDWWKNDLGIPGDFFRDAGALIQPGHSAFFYISRSASEDDAAEITRSYGGTFLATHLDSRQMAKIRAKVKAAGS